MNTVLPNILISKSKTHSTTLASKPSRMHRTENNKNVAVCVFAAVLGILVCASISNAGDDFPVSPYNRYTPPLVHGYPAFASTPVYTPNISIAGLFNEFPARTGRIMFGSPVNSNAGQLDSSKPHKLNSPPSELTCWPRSLQHLADEQSAESGSSELGILRDTRLKLFSKTESRDRHSGLKETNPQIADPPDIIVEPREVAY